jgi:ATP-dependent Clp protease ATP-binding subunit ClpC
MNEIKLNYKSVRAEKSRIRVKFSKLRLALLGVWAFLLLVFGILLLFMGMDIGWIFVGFSAIPTMIWEWYNGELHHLAISKNPQTIDDILSADILGRLSMMPTPREVAAIISSVSGGQFFATRFGISPSFLRDIASDNREDMQAVWQEAWNIRDQTSAKNISAAVLITAIIKLSPNHEALLGRLQLSVDDLMMGVAWFNHLQALIDQSKKPRKTGGLARDWSFGWTPLLNRFGQNFSAQVGGGGSLLFQLAAHDESLEQMVKIFSSKGRQNAALIGASGVGKTEIIRAFASKIIDASESVINGLKFRQVFVLDSSALIAAAPGRGELELLINQILDEAYAAKNVIICLDNAQLFFENGIGSVDITNLLLPVLENGNIRLILTMDEQRYLKISKNNPQIANALNQIMVATATRDETIAIMQDRLIQIEFENDVTFMYQSLVEAYKLSERYIYGTAMPGKAVTLLESAAHYSDNGLVTAKSVEQAIEKTLGVDISVAISENERSKLLDLETLIHKRMVNQKHAVSVVCDAIRRSKAGVRNQNKPVGTFLFFGPTGVGKTELAKALASVYFGDESRMIRLDMNEYTSNDDVARLIADGADDANSLTARIMKKPFSVVLFDEIEKAHPNVLLTLLQALDEGILRDIKNREISFRDAIIIATSNAGADRIREFIDRGMDMEQFEDKFIDDLINSNQFHPEFLNRFDEIVIFKPLIKSELLQIVDLLINDVNKTLEPQKVKVEVSLDTKRYLVEQAHDPKLGARPMRRIIQRVVENTVANQMLSGRVEAGDVIEIGIDQVQKIIESKADADKIASGE